MKNLYILTALLLSSFCYAQKFQLLDYSNFEQSDLKTNLFVKNVSPLSSIAKNSDTYTMQGFIQQYKEFANYDNNGLFNNLKNLQRFNQPINYSNTISIGLMHVEFETINKNNLKNKDISVDNGMVSRSNSDYIFNYNIATLITPLASTKRGLNTTFILNEDFYVNNSKNEILTINADFNNGDGLKKLSFNSPIQANYKTEGIKNILFIIELSNGETITRYSKITIEASKNDTVSSNKMIPSFHTSNLVADLSAYSGATSHAGLIEYEVFLGADNDLDKPIFIIDGFDPSDTRNIPGLYSLLDFDDNGTTLNLADEVRNNNDLDVVLINFPSYFVLSNGNLQALANSTDVNGDTIIDVLDYPGSTLVDGGADFIERNALSVVEIINLINGQKTSTEENVIIGPSMGGLISRYALNYMEANSLPHETHLWLSFDSPHLGANVPIGFQHLFNYLGYGLDTWVGDFSLEAVRPIVDGMLKSAAARQMLTDHFEPHLASGEIAEFDSNILLPIAHPYSMTFFNGINSLTTSGFPETTRNISLINGSGIGNPYQDKNGNNLAPGDKVIDAFLPGVATFTDAYFDTWFTPLANQTIKIDDVWIDAPFLCFCDINAEPDSQAFSYSNGIDAAPGGLFDLGALAAGMMGTDDTIDAFFNALSTDYFNFIPSVSAMALSTNPNINWFQNINLGAGDTPWDDTTITNSQTPFVNWYMPDNNEPHVTLTQQNVAFAMTEIIQDNTLNINTLEENNFIKLKNNPFSNKLTILSSKIIDGATITIVDVTGKIVYNMSKTITNETPINLKIASGIYVLSVNTNDNNIFKTKIIKQ